MWSAIAGTYEELDMKEEAIKCYKKAEANGDREGIALIKLARLFTEIDELDTAALYYSRNLEMRDAEGVSFHCIF